MNVNAMNTTNSERAPTNQCRQSSVIVRAREVAPVTSMMFNRLPSTVASHTLRTNGA
jgi:hypothetical protein